MQKVCKGQKMRISFTLDEETLNIITKYAKNKNLSQAGAVRQLIKQGADEKVKESIILDEIKWQFKKLEERDKKFEDRIVSLVVKCLKYVLIVFHTLQSMYYAIVRPKAQSDEDTNKYISDTIANAKYLATQGKKDSLKSREDNE